MAKNPKVKDPTEVALSAIQEALNISEASTSDNGRTGTQKGDSLRAPSFDDLVNGQTRDARTPIEPSTNARFGRAPANDDRETIGAILQTIQKGRPRRTSYITATFFAALWIAGAGLLTFTFLPSIQAVVGQANGGTLAMVGLAAMLLAPLVLFYFLASVAWRGQELSLIAQTMTQMAIRYSEPENIVSDGMITVGQAIRREVAAMGDGVERAIARAGELEVLVANEVSALERAYSDNEVRIRALLQDIAVQRDNLVGQAEQVRNAISGVQIDLRQDIALISDAIAARVDEVANNITSALEERSEHITRSLNNAGDNMIIALGERGGDLLDRLEEASSQTASAVLDASERLTASLNFKTGHVHEEFADLADRVHEQLNERLDRITNDFEQKSATIVNGISSRAEQVIDDVSSCTEKVFDSLKTSSDSLLVELDLRGSDLVGQIDDASNRLADRVLTSGDKAGEALDVTINTLVAKVVSQTETAHEALSTQIGTFEGLVRDKGSELAEKFARDSGTLGALITRHIAEFDRTLKTYGGDIAERMGQNTQTITENFKNYVETFDGRVASHGDQIHAVIDQRLTHFQDAMETRVTSLDSSLDEKVVALTEAIDNRSNGLNNTITARFQEIHEGLETRVGTVAADIETRITQFENLLDTRVDSAATRVATSGQQAAELIVSRAEEMSHGIKSRVAEAERSLSALMSDTSASIQNGARAAQQSLLSLSGEVSSHIKAVSTSASAQMTTASAEIERTVAAATDRFDTTLASKLEIIDNNVREKTERLSQVFDDKSGPLISAIANKSDELVAALGSNSNTLVTALDNRSAELTSTLSVNSTALTSALNRSSEDLKSAIASKSAEMTNVISHAADEALKSIESHGGAFTLTMMNNSSDLARQINTASEIATGAVNKSLKDIEESSRAAIEQSREVATATVTELQETSNILRTDTLALFERLREGNILLQEVLTSAHGNLNSLEQTLVTRVTEFVSTMNNVTSSNGAAAGALEEQLTIFNSKTAGALNDLGELAGQFEGHGRALAEAARTVEDSNIRASESVAERNATLESLVNTIDLRTLELDERLSRFTGLLEESLTVAENRARDIARVVAESTGASSSAVGKHFEAVRAAVEDERRQTIDAMADIYEHGTQSADAMFKQATDKFASVVNGMKHMAAELHQELETTRAELRRGILEVPQEAAESTAQMRKVIVDQIEALAELNRIVARHGRGLDVGTIGRTAQREDDTVLTVASSRGETQSRPAAPRAREAASANSLPPPDLGVSGTRRTDAPSVSPVGTDQGRDGWLSDLLSRADIDGDRDPRARAPQRQSINPLESLSLDIGRLLDRDMAAEMWDRYQRGERKAFGKRLYTPAGQKAFDEVTRKYRADRNFKQTVDRYINEFERLLDDVSRDERGAATLRSHLTSETGLVYTLLAHTAGRLA